MFVSFATDLLNNRTSLQNLKRPRFSPLVHPREIMLDCLVPIILALSHSVFFSHGFTCGSLTNIRFRTYLRLHLREDSEEEIDQDDSYARKLSLSISELLASRQVPIKTSLGGAEWVETDARDDSLLRATELDTFYKVTTNSTLTSRSEPLEVDENLQFVEKSDNLITELLNSASYGVSFEEAPTLPPEAYEDENLNYDGSLRGYGGPAIPPLSLLERSPNAYYTEQQYGSLTPEELHRMIMEQEKGYKNQSLEFKEALFEGMQNRTQVQVATEKRRQNLLWKAKQLDALSRLQKEMEGFETILERKEADQKVKNASRSSEPTPDRQPNKLGRIASNQSPGSTSILRTRQILLNRRQNDSENDVGNLSRDSNASDGKLEYYKREMLRYKSKAERMEKEIRRLRTLVKPLEKGSEEANGASGTSIDNVPRNRDLPNRNKQNWQANRATQRSVVQPPIPNPNAGQ